MGEKKEVVGKKRKLKIFHVLILLIIIFLAAFNLFRFNKKRLLRSRIEALRAAGYPVTCEELNKWYKIPDGAENAAYLVLDAIGFYNDPNDYKLIPFISQAELPARTEPLSDEIMKPIYQYLKDNHQTLELLHKASLIEYSQYPVDWSIGIGIILNHLGHLRNCVNLLNLESIINAENNNPLSATRSIVSAFKIAGSLEKEHLVVSQLVRFTTESLAVSTLERIINRTNFTNEQLLEMSKVIADKQILSGVSYGIVGEFCQIMDVFRKPESLINAPIGASGQEVPVPIPVLEAYKAMGIANKDAVAFIDLMTMFIEAGKLPLHERMDALKGAEKIATDMEIMSSIHIIPKIFYYDYSGYFKLELRNIAELRTAQAALAVQRYRLKNDRLPDSLSNLVPEYLDSVPLDPFDGQELRYKKFNKGFVIYSIGDDLHDDNGKEPPKDRKERNSSNWDINFTVEK